MKARDCCTITGQDYRITASIAATPNKGSTIVRGLFYIEYNDGLVNYVPLEDYLGYAEVKIFDIESMALLDTWTFNNSNSKGKYVVNKSYPFTDDKDYIIRYRIYLDSTYPYAEEYPYICGQSGYIERDLILHFRKPLGRYVKFFDEELGIIIE